MVFAGIFQPFARLRWIRFGLLMRDRKFSRRFSVPQTTALPSLSSANRTITPVSDFSVSASEFQPFPCRPSSNGPGEKLQALLSQREVMLQLPLHAQLQILRW